MENNWDMYDYILESKDAVRNIVAKQSTIFTEAIEYCLERKIQQIYLVGSGTSYHAALAARTVLEKTLNIKVNAIYPMQFKDNELITTKNTLVIGISHAGRSSSTILALDYAKSQGLLTIAMTAERNRPISKHADKTVYIEIGEELAGPKTKGFIGSIATVVLFGLNYGIKAKLTNKQIKDQLIERMVKTTDNIPIIAEKASQWYKENKADFIKSRRIIIVGYENCLAAMMEGTLKISEAVRYSVIGYEQEEFMHGIYHGIDENTYLIYLASQGQYYERCIRMKDYFEKERHNHNYLITSDHTQENGKNFVFDFVNDVYFETMEYIIPLQVIARKLSLDLGIDCNISSDPDFHKKMASYTY